MPSRYMKQLSQNAFFAYLFLASCGAVLLKVASLGYWHPLAEGDTRVLLTWTHNLLNCIAQGQYVGCVHAGHFPLLQYIPSLILHLLNFDQDSILRMFSYLSLISFGGIIGGCYWYSRSQKSHPKDRFVWYAFLLVFFSSPLLGYARSSFGEMVATFLIFACTVVCLNRGSGLFVFVLSAAVCLTKDFAGIFLALVGMAALMPDLLSQPARVKRHILSLAGGILLGLTLVGGFNYFRMGSVYNSMLLRDLFLVPHMGIRASFLLGLWFAPNGGLLFFWPTFILPLVYTGSTQLRLSWPRPWRLLRTAHLPLVLIVVMLAGLTYGLSGWFAPFGWLAWGPRLMLPWLPAVILLLLHFYHDQLPTAWLARCLSGWRFGVSLTFVVFLCLPQFYVVFDLHRFSALVVAPTTTCAEPLLLDKDAAYFYRCMQEFIWQPAVLIHWEVLRTGLGFEKVMWGLVYVLMFFSGCWAIVTERAAEE